MIKILNILYMTLAGFSGAYFECERLVSSSKWKSEYVKIPFWDQVWILPNSDSYHFMFGLTVLFFLMLTKRWQLFQSKILNMYSHIVIYWLLFWWFRNIGMHILFVNDNRWWYWFPPFISDLVKLIIGV